MAVALVWDASYRPVVAAFLGWSVAGPSVHDKAGCCNRFFSEDGIPRTDVQSLISIYEKLRAQRDRAAVLRLVDPLLSQGTVFTAAAREVAAQVLDVEVVYGPFGFRYMRGDKALLWDDRHALIRLYMLADKERAK